MPFPPHGTGVIDGTIRFKVVVPWWISYVPGGSGVVEQLAARVPQSVVQVFPSSRNEAVLEMVMTFPSTTAVHSAVRS